MLLSLKAGLHAAEIADRNGLDARLSLAAEVAVCAWMLEGGTGRNGLIEPFRLDGSLAWPDWCAHRSYGTERPIGAGGKGKAARFRGRTSSPGQKRWGGINPASYQCSGLDHRRPRSDRLRRP